MIALFKELIAIGNIGGIDTLCATFFAFVVMVVFGSFFIFLVSRVILRWLFWFGSEGHNDSARSAGEQFVVQSQLCGHGSLASLFGGDRAR